MPLRSIHQRATKSDYGATVRDIRAHPYRWVVVTAVLFTLWLGGAVAVPTARAAAPDDQARFLTLTNQSRAAAGLAPVAPAGALAALAARHSADMAGQNRLFHTPSLPRVLAGWSTPSEVVGDSDVPLPVWVDTVHRQFLASGVHRAVILNAAVTHVGIGVAYRGGKAFVTELYWRPSGAIAAPAVVRAPLPRVSRTRPA